MITYKKIYTINPETEQTLLGADDENIRRIEEKFKVGLRVSGSEVSLVIPEGNIQEERISFVSVRIVCILKAIELLLANKTVLNKADFHSLINNIDEENYKSVISLYLNKEIVYTTHNGKPIYPKTLNQKIYLKALSDNDIVFALGPAGTGKTYLAVMFALKYLKSFKTGKIVLVRPIVEAGEKLGFLPGDLKEKIDPYLIPIYDALYDALGKETVTRMMAKGLIEMVPLAYMRGRTLDNAVIILDEAQNATLRQMKMFLTRLGYNSKMIITGDITQIDLPSGNASGLVEATGLLTGIKGIKIIEFQKDDVMRHPLVFKIIERYENR